MAYYVRFEFFVPVYMEGPEATAKNRLRAFLVNEFRKAAKRKYGGSTGWNPNVPGLVGAWTPGRKTIPDELSPIWVLVSASSFESALEDFAAWKRLFEEKLGEDVLLVTH